MTTLKPQFLRVRNWEKFQHYKNRRPPWVRYHVEMLDDYELLSLSLPTQLVYDRFLLLAARTDNNIPHDPQRIGGQLNIDPVTIQEAIETLLSAGFLNLAENKRSASKVLARKRQNKASEAEAEAEGSEDSKAEADADEIAATVDELLANAMTDPVVRLMATIGRHADDRTEHTIRKIVASAHCGEADIEYARSCAKAPRVKNRAGAAVDALTRRAEERRAA